MKKDFLDLYHDMNEEKTPLSHSQTVLSSAISSLASIKASSAQDHRRLKHTMDELKVLRLLLRGIEREINQLKSFSG